MRRISSIPRSGSIPPGIRSGGGGGLGVKMGPLAPASPPVSRFAPNTVKPDRSLQDAHQGLILGLASQRDRILEVLAVLQADLDDNGNDVIIQDEIAWLKEALEAIQKRLL